MDARAVGNRCPGSCTNFGQVSSVNESFLSWGLFRLRPLVSQSVGAVGTDDDATIVETIFHDQMAHDGVLLMSVDADVVTFLLTIADDGGKDAVGRRGAGDAVDDVIRSALVFPLPVVDNVVGGVGSGLKYK